MDDRLDELEATAPDLPVMDCARCGKLMTGAENWRHAKAHKLMVCGGRVGQRPYCRLCLRDHPGGILRAHLGTQRWSLVKDEGRPAPVQTQEG